MASLGGEFAIEFFVGVAHKAINCGLFLGWCFTHVRPAITGMAGCAAGFIGSDIAAEIVNDSALAKGLARGLVVIFPFPVNGILNLMGSFGVAGQAGCGDVRS